MRLHASILLNGNDTHTEFFSSEEPFTWFGLKHKYYNVQLDYWGWRYFFDFTLDLSFWGRDHAGIELSVTILGLGIVLQIYDTRHWNDETNRWE